MTVSYRFPSNSPFGKCIRRYMNEYIENIVNSPKKNEYGDFVKYDMHTT